MLRDKIPTENNRVLLLKANYKYNKNVLSFDLDEAISFVTLYKPTRPRVIERWAILLDYLIIIKENYVDMYETNTQQKVPIKKHIVSNKTKNRRKKLKVIKEMRKLEFSKKWREMEWVI